MTSGLAVLLVWGALGYRAPTGEYPVVTAPSDVWVYFTDKGVRTESELDQALASFELRLAGPALERRFLALGRAANFDDLPPFERYVSEIEARGGQLRRKSAWLNAASFRMAPEVIARVAQLPFVHRIGLIDARWRPLAEETYVQPKAARPVRGSDTLGFKDIYGLAFAQNYMLGIPQVYGLGITGSGVRLGLLDTGLRRVHPAVKGLNVVGQHDFLVGDKLLVASVAEPEAVQQLGGVQDLGLAQSLVSCRNGDSVYLCYVADTALYGTPVRTVFALRSFDQGGSWVGPQAIGVPSLSLPTVNRPVLAAGAGKVFVAWGTATHAEGNTQIRVGWFQNGVWQGSSEVQPGRTPSLLVDRDSIYLVSLWDSALWFNAGSIAGPDPVWVGADIRIEFNELVREPWIVRDAGGGLTVAVTGWRTGKIYLYHSSDQGESFEPLPSPVGSGAEQARLWYENGRFHLTYKDYSSQPWVRLVHQTSPDAATWTKSVVVESLLGVGSFACQGGAELGLVYETEGLVRACRSSDYGASWSRPVALGSSEFARSPIWLDEGRVVWVENGDTTVGLDSGRFGGNQPDHGTRMASIIGSFRRGSMVGAAPGVEFLIAKTEYHSFRVSGIGYEYLIEEDNYIAGLEWAERHGASVISSSLGYTGWYQHRDFDGRTAPISVAAARAVERGLIVVTAMGNRADTLTPGEERWPRPFVVAPGDAFNVITVGGVEKSRRPWHTPGGGGTGCGPTPDGRHKPDLVAMGDSVTVVAPDSAGNVYEGSSGTSGATALIAGCCALVREAHPEWSAIQVRDSLLKYADRHAAPDDTFGHGIPDVYALLRNNPPAIKTLQGDEIGTIYPNPFRPGDGVRVYFPLLLLQPASFVTLSIFTLSGELVHSDTLKSSAQGFLGAPGRYADRAYLDRIGAYWDGKNNQGKLCAAGMYYAALQTGSGRAVRAFCLVR